MKGNCARRIPKFLGIAIVAIAVVTFVVMMLWNWLAPVLFGWHAITFWQALGLLVLCRLLFGGFRRGGGWGHGRWRRRMMERWDAMTPEERERLRKGLAQGSSSSPAPEPMV